MSQNELYSASDYKLVKLDKKTQTVIFGKPDGFVNVAALYSVSTFDHGNETCKILKHLNPNAKVVFDATVCVGGNTGPMGDFFEEVYGTELDKNNFILAKYNMMSRKNVNIFNESCIDFLFKSKRKFDAIIFDPPWNIDNAREINHSTVGIPDVSLKDNILFFLQYTDFILLKTSRNDDVRYYEEYLKDTLYEVLCLEISNYKVMAIAPLGSPGLNFKNYTVNEMRSFNYKKVLDEAGLLPSSFGGRDYSDDEYSDSE